jgi:serine protease AprX
MIDRRFLPLTFALAFSVVTAWTGTARAGVVTPDLESAIRGMKPGQEVSVLVSLADRVAVDSIAPAGSGRHGKAQPLVQALRDKAQATQGPVLAGLAALGGRSTVSLWAVNGIAVTVRSELVQAVAALPGVENVRLDATVSAPVTATETSAGPAEWNVQMIHAPDLWSNGWTGSGIVVAGFDTGVDVQHPDLGSRWRGGTNSWFDPNGQHATPFDASGHGTQTMGLIIGGSASGTAIGVAPGATWIAAKIFNDAGQATLSGIHQAFQWVLDPDGDPATDDLPDVVNNSWGFPSLSGTCYQEFANDIAILRAAGIGVVFSAGNEGAALGTSESPANNPGSLSVGAVDQTETVAVFSSRGPSACDGSIFPKLSAPGVSVKTSDLTFGGVVPNSYIVVSGTSFSAPAITGAMTLLLGAHPSAALDAVETALKTTAVDLGLAGPDNDTGYGLPDLVAADSDLSGLPEPPVANPDAYTATAGKTLTITAPGVLGNDTSPSGKPLSAVLVTGPTKGTLTLSADGSFAYVAGGTVATTDSFTYEASDGTETGSPATVTITVNAAPNQPPVAVNDSASTAKGKSVTINVLGNDYDPDGTLNAASVAITASPAKGTAKAQSNGTVIYTPKKGFSGTDTLKYTVKDNLGAVSNAATVTVTVK